MELRRLIRGTVSWADLESIALALRERYDLETLSVRFLDADNWLSTPMVVEEELFVKVISPQNTLVHSVFTTGRNLGILSSGAAGFFEPFQTPIEMARHELDATERMRSLGVNAPEPIEAFEHDGFGLVVLEYLPSFRSLGALDVSTERELAPVLFETLRTLHDHGLAHGDLRAENVLICDDELYFIDATNVNVSGMEDAIGYDVACALAALEPLIGAREAVNAGLTAYSPTELLGAVDFLDFVNIRPDHDCETTALKSELEKRATDENSIN
ncbi:RIO1 family regulatory kinase/ATPase domain-containing protein [Halalkalirubrum salinum]|uniref:RIO1 family regulatory kinase/ATPase domain-containing protein n=1 Tax=Halalkalirubrum salinum TaxID=2563889 RepID=UPI0010FBB7AD|nr:RIO1 family regulatory kinase/ATPase [Halalkalirubrum salinum]